MPVFNNPLKAVNALLGRKKAGAFSNSAALEVQALQHIARQSKDVREALHNLRQFCKENGRLAEFDKSIRPVDSFFFHSRRSRLRNSKIAHLAIQYLFAHPSDSLVEEFINQIPLSEKQSLRVLDEMVKMDMAAHPKMVGMNVFTNPSDSLVEEFINQIPLSEKQSLRVLDEMVEMDRTAHPSDSF